MASENVLVTGGAGYIGSHACKALKKAGYTPIAFDNLMIGWREAVKYGPFVHGDLLNRKDIDRVLKQYSPVAIIHFAALSQVYESMQKPDLYWENNVVGSLNLIQSAVENNCLNFVFSSTCAIYGDQDYVVLNENSNQNPINAYGATKRAVENILRDFQVTYGLKYVIFRYFNVAGADPDAEIGEFHKPETHLIPLIFDTLIGKQKFIKIFGTDYDTFDGTCVRDYVHVCDLVDAHILGLKWLQDKKGSNIFNLGTGEGFSVRQVINAVNEVTNHKVPTVETNRRPGDCAKLVSGSSRAETQLSWFAKKSNIKQIIEDAWRWHKKGFFNE